MQYKIRSLAPINDPSGLLESCAALARNETPPSKPQQRSRDMFRVRKPVRIPGGRSRVGAERDQIETRVNEGGSGDDVGS